MAANGKRTGLEPTVLALVVCDSVHIDPITGKYVLLGTFTEIESPDFPFVFPKMAIYVALTDGRGRLSVTIRLVDVDEEREPLWSDTQEVDSDDPRKVTELAIEALDTPFEESGIYRLQLLISDVTIMERSIELRRSDPDEE